jgi:subtilisin family serine protease
LPVPQFSVENAYATAPPLNLHPAKVINISMGTSGENFCDSATQAAVDAAKRADVTIVTSAGNSLMEATNSYPGNCFGTINVGATSSVGDRAIYSNTGPGVDVSAPGGDATQTAGTDADAAGMILSTINTGSRGPIAADYGYEEGTSMAAPLVAGVVALMYAAHPGLTFQQAATIIINTATPFNNDPNLTFNASSPSANAQLNVLGHCYNPHVALTQQDYANDGRCGAGIVNAGAAVAAAAALP